MTREFIERLEKSKWLPRAGWAAFVIGSLVVIIAGKLWQGLGYLLFFGGMPMGVILGGAVARSMNHFLQASEDSGKWLTAFFVGFGFLFVPPLVGAWTNAFLNTDVGMLTLFEHFLGACLGGAVFYCVALFAHEE